MGGRNDTKQKRKEKKKDPLSQQTSSFSSTFFSLLKFLLCHRNETKQSPTETKKHPTPNQNAAAQLSWYPHQHEFSISAPAAKPFSISVSIPACRRHELWGRGGKGGKPGLEQKNEQFVLLALEKTGKWKSRQHGELYSQGVYTCSREDVLTRGLHCVV